VISALLLLIDDVDGVAEVKLSVSILVACDFGVSKKFKLYGTRANSYTFDNTTSVIVE
jgi:hypothetical protein